MELSPTHLIRTRASLLDAGDSSSRIDRNIQRGALRKTMAGVYQIDERPQSANDRWLAHLAALCAKGTCVISHRSAAILHRLDGFNALAGFALDLAPSDNTFGLPLDVMVPAGTTFKVAGVFRSTAFNPSDTVRINTLPVTSLALTLKQLGDRVSMNALELAVESALRSEDDARPDLWNRTLHAELERVSSGHDRRKGTAMLRRLLAERGDVRPTGSFAETRVVQELRARSLWLQRQITVNVVSRSGRPRATYFPDFCDMERRAIIEIDGFAAHSSTKQLQRDSERQNLLSNFFSVRRYAAVDALRNPKDVGRGIANFLAAQPQVASGARNSFGQVVRTDEGFRVTLR